MPGVLRCDRVDLNQAAVAKRLIDGAFTDKPPADELATRLRALGYAARVAGVQPFVVLVGGYLDEPTAGRLVSNLQARGFDAVMNPANTPK